MPHILVVYGTTDGHTAKIAATLGETLRGQGADVDVIDAGAVPPSPRDYAGVIVAASLHAGGYQPAVKRWVRQHAAVLSGKPSAFVSVCLGVLQQEPKVQQELTAIVNRFMSDTGWQPTIIEPVAGALLYTKYNWIKRWIMKRIVQKAGGDTDTTRDYEYTNWTELRQFADRFSRLVLKPQGHQVIERRSA
jgi:menaquinone-dependent protoporphyrinogen oxidase